MYMSRRNFGNVASHLYNCDPYLDTRGVYYPQMDINYLIESFEELQALKVQVGKVFQPRTPITIRELFAGRWSQIQVLADAVNQPGLHVVIYGERGVGKTSLANIVKPLIQVFDQQKEEGPKAARIVVKTNANSGDTFSSIWIKVLGEITWEGDRPTAGLVPGKKVTPILEAFNMEGELTADSVRRVLSHIPDALFIIDEFDRAAADTAQDFTDLLKALSDFAVNCTVVLVGVSETIDTLVADHASINRALIQIMLPRMKAEELREILSKAEKTLNVSFSNEAANLVVHISQGLPHYTHLLGLHSVRIAADKWSRKIERGDIFGALKEAVAQAEQTVTSTHSKAVHSAHKDALYRQVLLAAGVAAARTSDPLGYFTPTALVDPLGVILNRDRAVQIATFNSHLADFCQTKRGQVLERDGEERGYRFRFHNPLLVPFVFMDAVATDLVSDEVLSGMLGAGF
jgi:Cdc6-like AAA superfamily ATPase